MSDWNVQFDGGQCSSKGRVGIAVDKDDIRTFLKQYLFDINEHSASHVTMAAAMDIKLVSRRIHAELLEEHIGHIRIKVLPSVNDNFANTRKRGDKMAYHTCLNELGACADDG
ncbi:hypothetical protein O999_22295 [Pseudomonas putida LF54]|nr:hypothetical protein O999_22295 [Pseudomonas putida LF54]